MNPDHIARIQDVLKDAGFELNQDIDSLDLASALLVLERSTGLVLPGESVTPEDVETVAQLAASFLKHAVPASAIHTVLELTLGHTVPNPRGIEYEAGALWPDARVGLTRGASAQLVAIAPSPRLLPIDARLAALLDPGGPRLGPDPESSAAAAATGPVADDAAEVEREVIRWVQSRGGSVWPDSDPVISRSELDRVGYLASHAGQAFELDAETYLVPAVCLGRYPAVVSDGTQQLVTFRGRAFRREPAHLPRLGRLPAFTVRELMWFGPAEWSDAVAVSVVDHFLQLARASGMDAVGHVAHDAFYLGDAVSGAKTEIRAHAGRTDLAVASVNRHGDHFVRRVGGRSDWVTGCAGIGLERWVLARQSVHAGA